MKIHFACAVIFMFMSAQTINYGLIRLFYNRFYFIYMRSSICMFNINLIYNTRLGYGGEGYLYKL